MAMKFLFQSSMVLTFAFRYQANIHNLAPDGFYEFLHLILKLV